MPAPPPKSVLEMILDWSKGRPSWQQDALRRIVAKGTLSATDHAELVALCKKGRGDTTVALTAAPLEKAHLPANPGAGQSVTLRSINAVVGVNQLAPQQDLAFEPTSLTIIYGDNGAGKSGYARILKRACRARHAGEIVPDVFDPAASATSPSADITYAVAGTAQPPAKWANAANPIPVLTAVNVFDGDCAAVQLREKNEVAFRPFGLDIPDELAAACQKVKELLTAEQQALEASRCPLFQQPTWGSETAVGKVMSALSAKTNLKPLQVLATVSDAERDRHRRLVEDLTKDPNKAAAEKEAVAASIAAVRTLLQRARVAASDDTLTRLKALADDALVKRTAAKAAADKAFEKALMPGVGGPVWRILWEAARDYSATVGSVGDPFPPSEGLCPLCHQDLDADAKARMAGFEEFVQADVEKKAKAAEKQFTDSLEAFRKYKLTGNQLASDQRQLRLESKDLARRALRAFAAARLRRSQCAKVLSTNSPLSLTPFPGDPDADLGTLQVSTKAYAAELRNATDVQQRKKLEAERDELRDRIGLGTLLPIANAEVERLKKLKLVSDCLKETPTNAITNLGNDIADNAITPQIRDRFQNEIVQLAANRIRVEVVRSGGKFGSPQYQVKLFANPNAKVHQVLSEGEQTCVALAAFLTELATATHQSALVFDDPVSSLDHRWRQQVARRLTEEAKVRQIVVFTHDIVFVNDLLHATTATKIPTKTISVARGPGGAGVVTDGLPWVAARIEDRLDKLEKEARAAKKAFDANDEDAYRDQVYGVYGRLRGTWERAIEQVVFHHVVLRHRDYVDTKYLRKATVLNDTDCDDFALAYKKCCDQVEAHDPSGARNAAPPPPNELLSDVKALGTWVKSIRDRQKKVA
jgi:energy-coupling factor transporter ATP-binding protein EcfA2